MNKESLIENLRTQCYGRNLNYYEVTDSTNTRAIELLNSKRLAEGTVFVAGSQIKGRGTSGNQWLSSTPDGLWMSVLVYEPLNHQILSFIPGIALVKMLNEKYNIPAHLKWPNDILVGSKKVAGILCEGVHSGTQKAWVVGVGLNVNQVCFPEEIQEKAISLHQITKLHYRIESLFQDFMDYFENTYLSDINVVSTWKKYSKIIGKQIKAKKNKELRQVTVIDVSSDGSLVVINEQGQQENWFSVADLDINANY